MAKEMTFCGQNPIFSLDSEPMTQNLIADKRDA